MIERFYKRLERESSRPYVMWALAAISFLESIIFPFPVDIFTFGLAAVRPKKWIQFATVGTVFSVLGALAAYALGYYLFDSFGLAMIELYGYQDDFVYIKALFQDYTFWVIFIAAFTPIPYKLSTVTGGALGVPLVPFIFASIIGRGIRFYLECYLAYRFGKKITAHIMNKINIYSLVVVGLVAVYFIIKLF